MHARGTEETVIGEYANEYMIMMQMTADDRKVVNAKEFVDRGYSEDYSKWLQAHSADA